MWYEVAPDDVEDETVGAGELLLVPAATDNGRLVMLEQSIAEISFAAGYYPDDILPNYTARDVELLHESRLLNHGLERFSCRRGGCKLGASWAMVIRNDGGDGSQNINRTQQIGSEHMRSV